jgi:hypothetical protein
VKQFVTKDMAERQNTLTCVFDPKMAPAQYGEIKSIQEESWSKAYRYVVSNGIKIVIVALKNIFPQTPQ